MRSEEVHDAEVATLLVVARQRERVGRFNRELGLLAVKHCSDGQVEECPFRQVVGGADGTEIARPTAMIHVTVIPASLERERGGSLIRGADPLLLGACGGVRVKRSGDRVLSG